MISTIRFLKTFIVDLGLNFVSVKKPLHIREVKSHVDLG
jgi:hypothetical protein